MRIFIYGCMSLVVSLLSACSSSSNPDPTPVPTTPIAIIGGTYSTQLVQSDEIVNLDGSESYDSDGDAIFFDWQLISKPNGSTASILDTGAENTSFIADISGDYEIQLLVSDNDTFSEPTTVLITAANHAPLSLNWGLPMIVDDGEDPDVSVNNTGTIVEVHESQSLTGLYYRVGKINGGLVDWGSSYQYDNGISPSIDINDSGVVVEAHRSETLDDIYYTVGKVDIEAKNIDFGSSKYFDDGNQPSIAINNYGHVLAVHRSDCVISAFCRVNGLYYHVGTVDVESKQIDFAGSKAWPGNDIGIHPQVDINDAGQVVEVHEGGSRPDVDTLWRDAGRLDVENKIFVRQTHEQYETNAVTPDIAINNFGRVIEVHKANTGVLRSKVGSLSNNNVFSYGTPRPIGIGFVPAVGINDRDELVAMNDHDTFPGTSKFQFYMSKDYLAGKNLHRWMGLTHNMHTKTLENIMLPGTHDSAAYALNETLNGDVLAARGPDFFDLESVCDFIDYDGWIPNWIENNCLQLAAMLGDMTAIQQNMIAKDVATAQSQSVGQQLSRGIRFFDLRATHRDGVYRAYHGLIGNDIDTILEEVASFLLMEEVEKELIMIEVSHLKTGYGNTSNLPFTDVEHEGLMALIVDKLEPYIYARNEKSNVDLINTKFQDLTADGPKLIFVYDDEYLVNHPDNPNAKYFWNTTSSTEQNLNAECGENELFYGKYTDTTALDDQIDGQRLCFDAYISEQPNKQFKHFQTLTADKDFTALNAIFHFVLDLSYKPKLEELSQNVNQNLSSFLNENLSDSPNVVLVDFFEQSDVVSAAIEINSMKLK